MLLPLLGYFFAMIAVLTAAVGVMLGLSNISTSERVRHYPRPVVQRNVKAINTEPRLFMVVPETKGGSPAKNMEANSAAVPAENADAKKSKPERRIRPERLAHLREPKVLAHQRQNYEGHGYAMTLGYSQGYNPGMDSQR